MRSLRARLLLSILLPVLIIVPVTAWVLNYLLQTQVVVAGISNELVRQAVLVADLGSATVEVWQDPGQARSFVARVSPRLSAKLMLLDPEGRLIVSSDPADASRAGTLLPMPDLQELIASQQPRVVYNQSQITDVIVPAVTPSGRLIGFVRLSNPLAGLYARSEQLGRLTLYVVGGGILAGLVLGGLLSRSLERPLRKASAAVYGLANGQTDLAPLKEEGPAEVRRLITAFNTLAEKLKASEQSRQRMLANMVHELGRPLGALLSATQALRGGAVEERALRNELLEGIEREITLLQNLLNDLVRVDEGAEALELQRERVQTGRWLPLILRTWEEAALQKGLGWSLEVPEGLPEVEIDPQKMAQAVENLVSNAVRYTPAGGRVRVSAGREGGGLVIRVCDSGAGIAPEEQERVFQPFYRGSSARRFSEGMGLGLTIARDAARAHGGELSVESTPGKGSCFRIMLPLPAEDGGRRA